MKFHELPQDSLNNNNPGEDSFNNYSSNDATKGFPVDFELVEGGPGGGDDDYSREGASYLCCSFSKLSTNSELQILTKNEMDSNSGILYSNYSEVFLILIFVFSYFI
jgi:hypothetical protein